MPAFKNSVIFCTNCYSIIMIHKWPLPYIDTCPYCGYTYKLLWRKSCKGYDVSHLKGLLVVMLHSEIGQKLLKLKEEKNIVVRALS